MIDSPKEWWTQVEAKESTSLENSIPIPTQTLELLEKLETENEQLKKDLEHARSYKHTIKMRNRNLQTENEKLKGELKKWEDRSKVVKDGYDGEVYEWEDNYYVVTPYLNVFVKGLLKENAKLKCLALHAMFKWAAAMACFYSYKVEDCRKKEVKHNINKMNRYDKKADKYCKAYRKAKKSLREGK